MSPMSLASSPPIGGALALSSSDHSGGTSHHHQSTLTGSPGNLSAAGLLNGPASPGSPGILGSPGTPGFDIDYLDSIRGPFATVRYVNYLSTKSSGSKGDSGYVGHAAYGSPISWKSGVLGKHIINKNDMFHAPLVSLFLHSIRLIPHTLTHSIFI